MLKSPCSNGDSLFSQVPPENAAHKNVAGDSSRSSCFDEEESATGAAEIAPMGAKPSGYVGCVKNEPVDNSGDLLLDDSLRLQIERSIEIVVNEFSLDSSATSSAAGDAEVGGAESQKLDQCVVDSSSASVTNDVNEPAEQPATSSAAAVDSAHREAASYAVESATSTSGAPTSSSQSVRYSTGSATSNVKCEPREQRTKNAALAHALPTACDLGASSATVADVKPFAAFRPSCLYSSAMKPSKEVEFALTPSVTVSSMSQPKACAAPPDKTTAVCPVSVKPISRAQPPASGYAPTLLGSAFVSAFPDCCDSSKLNASRGQFVADRYPLDAFSGCVLRKSEPPAFSCSSSLATSTSTSCFCTSSCYGKPCSRPPNQLLANSSLSQRALNLHNTYDLYPKGGAVPATPPFDCYRPKSSGPSCFRVPSSPRYGMPAHLPAKEPSSPHLGSLTSYGAPGDALASKSSSVFFGGSTAPKPSKNWNGSATAACMLPNSSVSPYKFQMPRIPSSPSALPSSYAHSGPMTAPPPATFSGFGEPSAVSTPRLYSGGNATSLMSAPTAGDLKSPQHSSVLQPYPYGSSLPKSQCCFPSQLQCYTDCCKEAQQQFSFV